MNPDGGMTMVQFIFWGVVIYVVIAVLFSYAIGQYLGGNK